MTQATSVLDKAHELAMEASRLKEGQAAGADADRVSKRVDELAAALADLRSTVATARHLRGAGVAANVDLSVASEGRDRFARHATGLPSNQVFIAARQKIQQAADNIKGRLAAEWTEWASQRLSALPTSRIAMLASPQERDEATRRRDELRKLVAKPPSVANTGLFQTTYGLLEESLAEVEDLPNDLVDLIQRLDRRPPITLADLSDEQVVLLRAHGVADQIELRRRGL